MEEQEFQNKVDALCADMRQTLDEMRARLDTAPLAPADRRATLCDVLTLLDALAAMQPPQSHTDFARFPEMAIFENLTPDQRRRVLAILAEGAAN